MKREFIVGHNGCHGWLPDPDEFDEYRESLGRAWSLWTRLWSLFRPAVTNKRIAYVRRDGGVSIVTPDDHFMMLLRRGGVVRHMRQIDDMGPSRAPVFEGSGETMRSMSEREALDFLAWKDIPHGVNRIVYLDRNDIPATRERRDAWRLDEAGRIIVGR